VVVQGPNAGWGLLLADKVTTIGRRPDSAICLEAQSVSRQHAQIVFEDGLFLVEDVGSRNGTFINGHRLAGRIPLGEHDTLQIGPYCLSLVPIAPDHRRQPEEEFPPAVRAP
jgi:pSer/pThr/pTyr-binding forkhead associated (FHA) protein